MNRTQLLAFRAVGEQGSFSKGAAQLMVSQPAVSLQVAELEAQLGTKLFDRLPRGARLTEAGTLLLAYARRIVGLEDEAEQAIRELQGLGRGRLRLGASLTVGSYVLPAVLGKFSRRYPSIELTLEIANSEQIERKLVDDALDLGFIEGLTGDESLHYESFYADRLVPICPPGHSILRQKRINSARLCRERMVFREKGSGTREVIEAALASQAISLAPVMSLGSTEAIKRAVMAGAGLAIVSELAIEAELKAKLLAVIPVTDLKIRRPFHVIERKGRSRSAAAREFLAMLPTAGK